MHHFTQRMVMAERALVGMEAPLLWKPRGKCSGGVLKGAIKFLGPVAPALDFRGVQGQQVHPQVSGQCLWRHIGTGWRYVGTLIEDWTS